MHKQVAAPPLAAIKRKRPKWRRRLIIAGVLLAVAVGGFVFVNNGKRLTIRVQPAATRDITQSVSATGKIRPEVEVKISPEVAGEIVELPVVDGQVVKKGDLLVKIRPDNYIAQERQAEAGLSSAQADSLERKSQMLNDQLDYHRSQDLFQKRLVSESDYKAAQTKSLMSDAAYESALHRIASQQSALEQAKVLLDKTVIYSPIDGTISALNSELGERVVATGDFAGTEVMRVANLDSLEALVEVNENDVVNVKLGDPVRVHIDAYPGHTFQGTVKRIASTATIQNQGTQQEVTNFEVRIRITHPDLQVRPGMSTTVEIETQTAGQVISVPVQSVTVRDKETGKTPDQMKDEQLADQGGVATTDFERKERKKLERVVFVKVGDTVKMVRVETGIADDNYLQILSGIKSGDLVVSGPYTAISKDLKDGSKVEIEKPNDAK
ncbi:MAG: efflux RND transporter periplasmic adaptor subunit [Verrucomicrobia bacterium]|nr:efflux RND transporter periplasmic adaptor subunit [Verrucomicrobiota bacterium]